VQKVTSKTFPTGIQFILLKGYAQEEYCKQNIPMTTIGQRIRQRRTNLGWTMQKVATLAGITQGYLSRLEKGTSKGTHEVIERIAGALGQSMSALYATDGNVEHAPMGHRRIPVHRLYSGGPMDGSTAIRER
jgi:DNA-binding XRE family transcriptional regulator